MPPEQSGLLLRSLVSQKLSFLQAYTIKTLQGSDKGCHGRDLHELPCRQPSNSQLPQLNAILSVVCAGQCDFCEIHKNNSAVSCLDFS